MCVTGGTELSDDWDVRSDELRFARDAIVGADIDVLWLHVAAAIQTMPLGHSW